MIVMVVPLLLLISFPDGFFYFVATGWIFEISLCENSINQCTMMYKTLFESNDTCFLQRDELLLHEVIND